MTSNFIWCYNANVAGGAICIKTSGECQAYDGGIASSCQFASDYTTCASCLSAGQSFYWCDLTSGNDFCNEDSTCAFEPASVITNPGLCSCGDGTCDGIETCSNCALDCGVCPEPSGCVMHLSFDEGSGMVAHDSCGDNNGILEDTMDGNCYSEYGVLEDIYYRSPIVVGDGQSFVAEYDSLRSFTFLLIPVRNDAVYGFQLKDGWDGNVLAETIPRNAAFRSEEHTSELQSH